MAIHEEIINEGKTSIHSVFDGLDEERLEAQQNLELCQWRMFNAASRVVPEGDLVVAFLAPMNINKKKGKIQPNWEGPFIVEMVYSNGHIS